MNHKIRAVVLFLALLSLVFGTVGPAAGQEVQAPYPFADLAPEFKAGEVLVKFRDRLSADVRQEVLAREDATYRRSLIGGDVELWQVKPGRELEIVTRLEADPAVEYAELNWRYYALGEPDDALYPQQWAHVIINSPQGWDIGTGSTDVVIAIVDTGIDEGHPDLSSRIIAGRDFVDGDTNPHDLNGHGTHCAGIAAAVTDNGIGVAGMDWQARIMAVRVLDSSGSGWMSDIVDGITWAHEHGADVISLSLGGPQDSQTLQDAVTAAYNGGSLVVAAMGNYRTRANPPYPPNAPSYPAANDNVMAVAATTRFDTYADYSQYGIHCDIAAPGGEMDSLHDFDGILSTLPTYSSFFLRTQYGFHSNYDQLEGTSMATPFVAGLAALIWAQDGSLSPDEVQQTIQTTAVDLGTEGWDPDYGWGRINVLAALEVHAVPSAPTLLPIDNPEGDGDYSVDWTDAAYASGYVLQEDDSSAFSSPTVRYSGPNSQASILGRGPGTWYYRVLATAPAGDSSWSNVERTTVKPEAPLLANINNTGQEDQYLITWSAAAGATGYVLEEDDDAGFTSPTTRYVGAATEYNVTGQAGGTWHYRVYANNDGGSSPASNVVSTTVAMPALGAPTLFPIDNADDDDAYLVDWSDVADATSYVLEESLTPYFEAPTEVYNGAASQFDVAGQAPGTRFYRVRALGVDLYRGPWSAAESVVVPAWIYLPLVSNGLPAG